MKITFDHYARKRGTILRPWQKKAANALLAVIHQNREGASGKTALVNLLRDFINENGVDFALRAPRGVKPPVVKRRLFLP